MRRLALLVLLLAAPLAAQPLPAEDAQPRRGFGGTHFFGELAGASFLGVSLNVEQPLAGPLAARGGLGLTVGGLDGGLDPTLIGGLAVVPGGGAYRPEVAVTATMVSREEEPLWLGGPYLGVRYHTRGGSVLRLGAHLLLQHDEGDWNRGPWPTLSFGRRL
jgi:hypothetical protein